MDFITALGRLLHDGALRDEFAVHPLSVLDRLEIFAADRSALLALPIADLEFQAGILLDKRFDLIKEHLPRTLATLEQQARPTFFTYARKHWPQGPNQPLRDAAEFCQYCAEETDASVCKAEWNRLRFALSQRLFSVHFVSHFHARQHRALHVLVQRRAGGREFIFYLAL